MYDKDILCTRFRFFVTDKAFFTKINFCFTLVTLIANIVNYLEKNMKFKLIETFKKVYPKIKKVCLNTAQMIYQFMSGIWALLYAMVVSQRTALKNIPFVNILLCYAARYGNAFLVNCCLRSNANPYDAIPFYLWRREVINALQIAIVYKQSHIFMMLSKKRSDIFKMGGMFVDKGRKLDLLDLAMCYGQFEIIKEILSKKNKNLVSGDILIKYGHIDTFKRIYMDFELKNTNIVQMNDVDALECIIKNDRIDLFKALLKMKFSFATNIYYSEQWTNLKTNREYGAILTHCIKNTILTQYFNQGGALITSAYYRALPLDVIKVIADYITEEKENENAFVKGFEVYWKVRSQRDLPQEGGLRATFRKCLGY